jgi:hypothetical protein
MKPCGPSCRDAQWVQEKSVSTIQWVLQPPRQWQTPDAHGDSSECQETLISVLERISSTIDGMKKKEDILMG